MPTPDAAHTIAELEEQKARGAALVVRCDELAGEIARLRRRLSDADVERVRLEGQRGDLEAQLVDTHARLADAYRQLGHANATITLMEHSRFWQARRLWVRVRSLAAPLL